MERNSQPNNVLLRCRPENDLMDIKIETNVDCSNKDPLHQDESFNIELELKENRISNTKRTYEEAGLKKSTKNNAPKRSTRKSVQTIKYKDFIDELSEESSGNEMNSKIIELLGESSGINDSDKRPRKKRQKKHSRFKKSSTSIFSDCSDVDETYDPSNVETTRSTRVNKLTGKGPHKEIAKKSADTYHQRRRKTGPCKSKSKDFQHEFLLKIELEDDMNANISDAPSHGSNNECKKEANDSADQSCNGYKKGLRYRKPRKKFFEEDTASSVESFGEGEEVDVAEIRKISKKIWHNDYGYIVSRTLPNGHIYLRCHRGTCKGTAYHKNGRIYTGNQKHDHSRRQDAEVREIDEYRAELYKVVHEQISTNTREIYEMVGAKFPKAAKKMPFPQMNNLMRRWKRNIELQDNVDSLSELADIIEQSNIDSSTRDTFLSGKVTSPNDHVAVVLGFKEMIQAAYSRSKLLYIDVNVRAKCTISQIQQIITTFCISQGKVLPMCYVLMENNSEELYEAVFEHIKNILAPAVDPQFIICDYEENLRNALIRTYSKSHLHGHFYHYAQRIYQQATKLKLISVKEGEIANNLDHNGHANITGNDKIIMEYYSLALLPEKFVKEGLDYIAENQPEHFHKLLEYVQSQWINRVGIKHFAMFQEIYRTNDVLDVYSRKINDILKNCLGLIKIYDAFERHHEFIRKQCTSLLQGERVSQGLSKQDKLFHPFLKDAWEQIQAQQLTVAQFMDYCSQFMHELHHIFKYWHVDKMIVTKLSETSHAPFVPREDTTVEVQMPKPITETLNVVRPYAKISPNREIRYRNSNVFRHDGYAYNRQNTRVKDGVVVKYMACRTSNCNGTLILRNDVVTPGKNGHNHPKEEVHNSERIMDFKQQLRAFIREHRNMATNEIYKIAAEKNPEGAQVYPPRLAIQAMGRWKREFRSSVTASTPTTLSSLDTILRSEEGKQHFTIDSCDANYYSGTVNTTTGQCAVIFGDKHWILDNFKASQNWIIDSNYRGASKEPSVHHVLVVLSLSREHVLPIAYILMEDRSEDLYTAVFSHIKKNLGPGIYPSFIMCDYDEMIHNAIKDVYNEAILQGSLYHYAQAIYRKAYSLNLISNSNTDSSAHRTLLQYYALALLPSDLIEPGLESLRSAQLQDEQHRQGFSQLYIYVKNQWLGRVGATHMSTFLQCYRTSNVLELFQRVFNDKLSAAHPPIFELLELIQKTHNTSKSDCDLLHKSKRQYVDRIGQRFDRLVDFKVNSLWKKLANESVAVEGFLNVAVDYLESLHYVYNTWDLHDDTLDINTPLMIEDSFVLQTDDLIRATVSCAEIDDVPNIMFECTTDQKGNVTDISGFGDFSDVADDKVNILKRIKPKGRIIPKKTLNGVWQDGYCYYGNRIYPKTENGPEKRYLQCRIKGCRGTAMIINGEFHVGKNEHNHKRDYNKEQIEDFKKAIKEMVFSQPLTNKEIYELAAIMNPTAASFVSYTSLESHFRRWRTTCYIPSIPKNLADLDKILTDPQGINLVHTRHGSLYSGTVTLTNGRCAVILCEEHFVKQFQSCTSMYVERSWRCASRDVQISCVIAVLFVLGFQVVPVAYFLVEDDSEELCYAAFDYFKSLIPNFNPTFIMCDYDDKLHNVLGRIYCEANIQGCFFHYCKAVYRKAYSLGLVDSSEQHENCKLLKQFYAIALLPAESIVLGLQYLSQIQPKSFIDLWNYVKIEWFDQVGSEHLSVYKQPLRCNDIQEHFHKRHNGLLEEAHPGIIHLIVHLKKTHDTTLSEYGTRLKQRPAQSIRKSKQLFHSHLNPLWGRFITSELPVNDFVKACENIMGDIHYVFNTWDKEEHVTDICIPYMRNCAFVQNPDVGINANRLFKKETTNKNVSNLSDSEQSDEEFEDRNNSKSKKVRAPVIRYTELLWRDGYGFHIVKRCTENAAGNLVTYIRCKTASCRVRGSIVNEKWNLTTELHNHNKDLYAEEDAAFRLTLKHMVRDQPLPLDEIYNLAASLYPDSAERTPMKKMRPIMIRWKKRFVLQVSTKVMSSLLDVDQLLIGDSGVQLINTPNGSIYSGNVITQSGHCALVFAEQQFTQEAFLASANLFIDTNYRCTPRDPYVDHVLIFFGVYRDNVLPFAYVLMSANDEELYVVVLKYIRDTLAPNINPEYIMCDYDNTLHSSIKQVYSSAQIHGCFYHYAQSIYRKAVSLNIIDLVQPDNEHYSTLMKYYTLALLPKDDIETAFLNLSHIQPAEFKDLSLYVRDQWLERVGVAHLSVFGQPYRANASFEVLSRKLNDMSKEAHPNVYDLIGHLLKLHQMVRADYDLLRRGRHAHRVGRTMDRLFHMDVRRAWQRLGDDRISATDFMHMAVVHMANTHFVFSTWDVTSERLGSGTVDDALPYLLEMPFVAHWCVDNMGEGMARVMDAVKCTGHQKSECIEEREYASGEDNCDGYDDDANDSPNEIIDPTTRYGGDQIDDQPRVIVEQQEQFNVPVPTSATIAAADKKLCFLCNAHNRTHACIPCGHLSYCVSCLPVVSRRVEMDKKCPICQAQYMLVLEIHF